MLEWLKRHAWKACVPQKGIRSSNLLLSAKVTKKWRQACLSAISSLLWQAPPQAGGDVDARSADKSPREGDTFALTEGRPLRLPRSAFGLRNALPDAGFISFSHRERNESAFSFLSPQGFPQKRPILCSERHKTPSICLSLSDSEQMPATRFSEAQVTGPGRLCEAVGVGFRAIFVAQAQVMCLWGPWGALVVGLRISGWEWGK